MTQNGAQNNLFRYLKCKFITFVNGLKYIIRL